MIILVNPSKTREYGFVNEHGKDVKVLPNKEAIVSETDLMNLHSTSKTFSGGYLNVKNIDDLPDSVKYIFATEDERFEINEEEITSLIKGNFGKFKAYIKSVEERNNNNEKRILFEIASTIEELNMKKARDIEDVTGFDFKLEADLKKMDE